MTAIFDILLECFVDSGSDYCPDVSNENSVQIDIWFRSRCRLEDIKINVMLAILNIRLGQV